MSWVQPDFWPHCRAGSCCLSVVKCCAVQYRLELNPCSISLHPCPRMSERVLRCRQIWMEITGPCVCRMFQHTNLSEVLADISSYKPCACTYKRKSGQSRLRIVNCSTGIVTCSRHGSPTATWCAEGAFPQFPYYGSCRRCC